jgi:hypothetical protein
MGGYIRQFDSQLGHAVAAGRPIVLPVAKPGDDYPLVAARGGPDVQRLDFVGGQPGRRSRGGCEG